MATNVRLDDLLDPALADVVEQWFEIHGRSDYEPGRRQPDFTPAEVILCQAASKLVDHRRFGSSTAHTAPEPVPGLAALFHRPVTSVLAKMANLDGSRPNGGKFDRAAGAVWSVDSHRMGRAYSVVLVAARRAGVPEEVLPDFLAEGWRPPAVLPSL